MDTLFDHAAPFEPIKGESKKANYALKSYCWQGPSRSLRKVQERLDLEISTELADRKLKSKRYATLSTLHAWSVKWHWVARAAAFDLAADRERSDIWRERREKIREDDFTVSNQLRDLALQILAASPNFIHSSKRRIKGADGNPDTILVTTALDGDMLVKLLDLASKLQRAAAGIANNNFVFPVDWSTLTDAQVAAMAAGDNPLEVLSKGSASNEPL